MPILKEINERLKLNVGSFQHYHVSPTLSGGEAQRIRLASQIDPSNYKIYVLDEPSICHIIYQNNNCIKKLRDLGNTVIVVEHDIETMEC